MHSPFFLLAGSVLQHAHHRLQRARRASQPCAALWTRTCTPIKNDRNTPDYLFIYNLLLWFKTLFWILWNGITCWRRPSVCSNWGVFTHVHAGDRREAHCRQGDVLFNGLDYILYGFFFFITSPNLHFLNICLPFSTVWFAFEAVLAKSPSISAQQSYVEAAPGLQRTQKHLKSSLQRKTREQLTNLI